MNIEDIKNLWVLFAGIITSIGAGLLWIAGLRGEVVRLRSDVVRLGNRHEEQRKEHEKKEALMWAKIDVMQNMLSQALQSLARLEGNLESHRKKEWQDRP